MKTQQSILAILCISFFYTIHYSQTKPTDEIPYIEVNGYAEKEIIPNEIYIGITLRERMENKEKVTIEAQEKPPARGRLFSYQGFTKGLNLIAYRAECVHKLFFGTPCFRRIREIVMNALHRTWKYRTLLAGVVAYGKN